MLSIFVSSSFLIEAAEDRGQESVGKLKVSLYYGTNDTGTKTTGRATALDPAIASKLKKLKGLEFSRYLFLGEDVQPILRSYESWIAPLKPSEEILLRYEPRGDAKNGSMMLDLEFWQSRKKIMKAGPLLEKGKPLYILGPQWRDGRVIIAVELIELIEIIKK